MAIEENMLKVYPQDKVLRVFVKPIVEYPISYVLLQSALRSCGFANSLTQSYSVVSHCWLWMDTQVRHDTL